MTPEQKAYSERELARIRRGGDGVETWVHDWIGGLGSAKLLAVNPPVVGLGVGSDIYANYFQSRDELEAFIDQLRGEADKAWGKVVGDQAASNVIYTKALELVQQAKREGVVLTIETEPKQPLAMGNYRMVVAVRPARGAA